MKMINSNVPAEDVNPEDLSLDKLLDHTDDLESKLRMIQSDLNHARYFLIKKVIEEGWMHCLTVKKSAVRRQIYRNKY